MGIKKRMWPRQTQGDGARRISRGPLREVIHIESSDTKRGGIKWTLRLECEHLAFRYAKNPLYVGIKPMTFAPKRCRCTTCGLLAGRMDL